MGKISKVIIGTAIFIIGTCLEVLFLKLGIDNAWMSLNLKYENTVIGITLLGLGFTVPYLIWFLLMASSKITSYRKKRNIMNIQLLIVCLVACGLILSLSYIFMRGYVHVWIMFIQIIVVCVLNIISYLLCRPF